MAKIESKKVQVAAPSHTVFEFLSDFSHFEKLLPADKVSKVTIAEKVISFQINGLATIGMRLESSQSPNLLHIVSEGKNPFDFTLDIHLNEINASTTEAYLVFDGNMNPFLKMMVEKPLGQFFNQLADRLSDRYQAG